MSTIIALRGTSGSGKSTIIWDMRARWPFYVVETTGKREKPLVYAANLPSGVCYIFGSYRTQCGGCDTIQDYKNVVPDLLRRYAPKGDIIFEGLLIGGGYGAVGEELGRLEKKGHRPIFAFLDTPLELCLDRITARRKNRGVTEPLNPANTEQKYKAIISSRPNIEARGHTCVTISHQKPFSQTMKLLGVTVREPKVHASAAMLINEGLMEE